MKTVTVVVPTYNEEENVPRISERIKRIFEDRLLDYQYEILFIDNFSTDGTRKIIEHLANEDKHIKAIFNARNFGFSRSTFYGLSQAEGDCAVLLFADMQDPPELIIDFVERWEKGARIVVGIKNKSKENWLKYRVRQMYYDFIKKIGDVEHIEQFTGFGLYDASFIKVLKQLDDPLPYLRGIVAELGYENEKVYYEQQKRQYGKTSFNFMKLYDTAMLGITSYSKTLTRIATIAGFIASIVSLIIAFITFIMKLCNWNNFSIGIAAISIGVYFFGSVILFFVGLIGEYIVNINVRTMHHPLVVEDKRINFEQKEMESDSEALKYDKD